MKYCQGTLCHTYYTQDRLKGSKGNKRNETRKRTSFSYGQGNFCSLRCQDDWFQTNGDNAINHFGRLEHPIILTEDNAWSKEYNHDWYDNRDTQPRYHEVNQITKATRPCEQGDI
jgi:hypothetical protein